MAGDESWVSDHEKEVFLLDWQIAHHPLSEEHKALFLKNINLEQILIYPAWAISKLLPMHKRLDTLRNALWLEVYGDDVYAEYFEITPESLGMKETEPWVTTLNELGLE